MRASTNNVGTEVVKKKVPTLVVAIIQPLLQRFQVGSRDGPSFIVLSDTSCSP
jgi:hypothetical protein